MQHIQLGGGGISLPVGFCLLARVPFGLLLLLLLLLPWRCRCCGGLPHGDEPMAYCVGPHLPTAAADHRRERPLKHPIVNMSTEFVTASCSAARVLSSEVDVYMLDMVIHGRQGACVHACRQGA